MRLWLTDGVLDLDERLEGLRALVPVLEERAAHARRDWRQRLAKGELLGLRRDQLVPVPSGSVARQAWLGLSRLLDQAMPAVLETLALTILGGLRHPDVRPHWRLALGASLLVVGYVRLIARLDRPRSAALPGTALWLRAKPVLAAVWRRLGGRADAAGAVGISAEGVWLDGRLCPWSHVTAVGVAALPGGPGWRVTLQADGQATVFTVPPWGASAALRVVRLLADLTQHDFVSVLDEPAPDNALSLARLSTDARPASRGLSVTVGRADDSPR